MIKPRFAATVRRTRDGRYIVGATHAGLTALGTYSREEAAFIASRMVRHVSAVVAKRGDFDRADVLEGHRLAEVELNAAPRPLVIYPKTGR